MLRDYLDLVRAPAALSVPGDVIAGATASGRLTRSTASLAAASICFYYAGMAANDWADRDLDAIERPERPIPSGRVTASSALTAASGLTAAGLAVSGLSGGKRALSVAVPLTAAIWSYDLRFKNSPYGPAAMSLCRFLNVLLGATSRVATPADTRRARATRQRSGGIRRAIVPAAVIAAHTYVVTELSRHEVKGVPPALPAITIPATAAIAAAAPTLRPTFRPGGRFSHRSGRDPAASGLDGWRANGRREPSGREGLPDGAGREWLRDSGGRRHGSPVDGFVAGVLAGWYAARFGAAQRKLLQDPSGGNVRASVGAGIMALPALQGALTARYGRPVLGTLVALGAAAGKRLARRAT